MVDLVKAKKINVVNIPSTSVEDIKSICALEKEISKFEPDFKIKIEHFISNSVYVRTAYLPPHLIATNVLIKIPTTIIAVGDLTITGSNRVDIKGHKIIKAQANRKNIIVTRGYSVITMFFKTEATDVIEAEKEFTDDFSVLKKAEKFDCEVV
jgi:hypothetical protein